ncbi:hypothetical protein [Paenibacillus sp. YN15]|uniref:hypothetical protein n=1 Tax=Paenibacillus sp. YN15 TaxID=1742774 RepID=UPI000DCE1412|nr:hypothetical protein [Paenibacillus sp. YN15]RAU95073.1 hypothetical protein DQG13_22675 [Paenibacillus sp. YN15]
MGDEIRQLLSAVIKNQEIANAEMQGRFDRIDGEFRNVYKRLGDIQSELTEFKAEMTEFKVEMTEFKAEMTEFKSEIKTEMAEFKSEMRSFQDDTRTFQQDVRNSFLHLDQRLEVSEMDKIQSKRRLSGIEQDLDRTILRLDKLEDIVHQSHGME